MTQYSRVVKLYLLCAGYSSSLSESSLSDTWWPRRLLDFPRGTWWMWCTVGVSVTTPDGTTVTPGNTPVVITGVPVVAPGYVLVWWWTGDETTLTQNTRENYDMSSFQGQRGSFIKWYFFVKIYFHKLHLSHLLVVVGRVGCRRRLRGSRIMDKSVC